MIIDFNHFIAITVEPIICLREQRGKSEPILAGYLHARITRRAKELRLMVPKHEGSVEHCPAAINHVNI